MQHWGLFVVQFCLWVFNVTVTHLKGPMGCLPKLEHQVWRVLLQQLLHRRLVKALQSHSRAAWSRFASRQNNKLGCRTAGVVVATASVDCQAAQQPEVRTW